MPIGNVSEHRAMCAFIIAMFCKDFHQGQVVCLSPELIESCLGHLQDFQNPLLRQWSCLCISMLWYDFPEAKWVGIRCSAHQRLCDLVVDPVAEVRAAMLHALTTFLGIPDLTPQVAEIEESIASIVLIMTSDGNTMVRKELLIFFSTFVARYQNKFIVAAYEQLLEEKASPGRASADPTAENGTDAAKSKSRTSSINEPHPVSADTIFSAIWKELLIMSVDPHLEIAQKAGVVVDYIYAVLIRSPLGQFAAPIIDSILQSHKPASSTKAVPSEVQPVEADLPSTPPAPVRVDSYLTASLKRTASVAVSLKNLAWGNSAPASDDDSPSNSVRTLPAPATGARGRLPSEWNRPPDEKDHHYGLAAYPALREPLPRNFKARDAKVAPSIPLRSNFYQWSVEYFREPQMKPAEADEPGSTDYNERLWRRNRNDKIIAKTQPQKDMAGSNAWDRSKAFLNNGTQPMKMCFHQFEEHLVITDDRDGVS